MGSKGLKESWHIVLRFHLVVVSCLLHLVKIFNKVFFNKKTMKY